DRAGPGSIYQRGEFAAVGFALLAATTEATAPGGVLVAAGHDDKADAGGTQAAADALDGEFLAGAQQVRPARVAAFPHHFRQRGEIGLTRLAHDGHDLT